MKHIIEFNYPDDKEEHKITLQASDMYCAISDFDNWLRNEIKHGGKDQYQEIRDKFLEVMKEYEVEF